MKKVLYYVLFICGIAGAAQLQCSFAPLHHQKTLKQPQGPTFNRVSQLIKTVARPASAPVVHTVKKSVLSKSTIAGNRILELKRHITQKSAHLAKTFNTTPFATICAEHKELTELHDQLKRINRTIAQGFNDRIDPLTKRIEAIQKKQAYARKKQIADELEAQLLRLEKQYAARDPQIEFSDSAYAAVQNKILLASKTNASVFQARAALIKRNIDALKLSEHIQRQLKKLEQELQTNNQKFCILLKSFMDIANNMNTLLTLNEAIMHQLRPQFDMIQKQIEAKKKEAAIAIEAISKTYRVELVELQRRCTYRGYNKALLPLIENQSKKIFAIIKPLRSLDEQLYAQFEKESNDMVSQFIKAFEFNSALQKRIDSIRKKLSETPPTLATLHQFRQKVKKYFRPRHACLVDNRLLQTLRTIATEAQNKIYKDMHTLNVNNLHILYYSENPNMNDIDTFYQVWLEDVSKREYYDSKLFVEHERHLQNIKPHIDQLKAAQELRSAIEERMHTIEQALLKENAELDFIEWQCEKLRLMIARVGELHPQTALPLKKRFESIQKQVSDARTQRV